MRNNIKRYQHTPVTFHTEGDKLTAVLHTKDQDVGMVFGSPEKVMEFLSDMLDAAAKLWPDDPYIRMYTEDEEGPAHANPPKYIQ